MDVRQIQLKLVVAGCLGLGFLWPMKGAMAQPLSQKLAQSIPSETTAESVEATSHHRCATNTSAHQDSLRLALLETAAATARAAESISESSLALVRIGESYVCFGQPESAKVLIEEALTLSEQLEDPNELGSLLLVVEAAYREQLNDSSRTTELLSDAMDLAAAAPKENYVRYELVSRLATRYVQLGEYEKVRDAVALVTDASLKESLIYSLFFWEYETLSETDKRTVEELFPTVLALLAEHSEYRNESSDPLTILLSDMRFASFGLESAEDSDAVPVDVVDEFILGQQNEIETLDSSGARGYAYLSLAERVAEFGYGNRVIDLLDLALAEAQSEEALLEDSDALHLYVSTQELLHRIVFEYMFAGAVETGLSLLNDIEDLNDQEAAYYSLAQTLTYEEEPFEGSGDALRVAESVLRNADNRLNLYMTTLASAYVNIGDIASADRLTQELLVSVAESSDEDLDLSLVSLVYVLMETERYEDAIALAHRMADALPVLGAQVLAELPASLLEEGEEALSLHTIEMIDSPYVKAIALSQVSEAYGLLEQPDRAFDAAAQALTIAQSAEFSEDPIIAEILAQYGENPIFSGTQIEGEKLFRDHLFQLIFFSFSGPSEDLLALVEDESIRTMLIEEVLPYYGESDGVSEHSEQAYEAAYELRQTAYDAAKEDRFAEAIEAISALTTPLERSRVLLTIAKCYVGSDDVIDDETQRLLQQMQQQSQ
ncbi:MAG: hypothetical protein AAFY72_11455 [Cyanobacteria bacterium J06649_4]